MIRILLIESRALDVHRLRSDSRRAGLCFIYDAVTNRAQFLRLLAGEPEAIVVDTEGLPDLPLQAVLLAARDAQVPVVVLGGDTEHEHGMLREIKGLYTASLRRSRMAWLPVLLERTMREHQLQQDRLSSLAEAEEHLQRSAEQMREVQKLAIIGRLAGSIAHEINNPLESITNLTYLLSVDEQMPEHLRAYLALAQQELDRVAKISKQTLRFCRETQTPVEVEPSELLDEVLVLYARRISERRIQVERRYESRDLLLLYPGEMRQVYANLVANAIEATEPGGRIVVRIHRVRQWKGPQKGSSEGVRVVVADSGCGIPSEVRARLGQPFYTTKGQGGTGLGLWVSKAIVTRYKGDLRMRSSTAPHWHGTTFSVFLPLSFGPRIVERPERPLAQQSDTGSADAHEGIRIYANNN